MNEDKTAPPKSAHARPKQPDPPNEAEIEIVKLTRGLRFWTMVMGACAVVAVAVSVSQCVEMKGQLAEMKSSGEQTNRAIEESHRLADLAADEAGISVDAQNEARASATAALAKAEAANDISRRTANESERAWISPVGVSTETPPKEGEPIDAFIAYVNTGHSPARDVNIAQEMTGVPLNNNNGMLGVKTPDFPICDSLKPIKGGPTVYPSPVSMNATRIPRQRGLIYSKDTDSGKIIMVWQVCFSYETLGRSHTSRACYWLRPIQDTPMARWQWDGCIGNRAD